LFNNEFKKDKIFSDLLLEICKIEIHENFMQRAKFKKDNKDNVSPGSRRIKRRWSFSSKSSKGSDSSE
jgi:hypothetical protein